MAAPGMRKIFVTAKSSGAEQTILSNLAEFDRMLALATKAIEFLRNCAPWQLEAVQAGRDGKEAMQVWVSLARVDRVGLEGSAGVPRTGDGARATGQRPTTAPRVAAHR